MLFLNEVKEDNLLAHLSNGEKKALYLLNIIFETEARKTMNKSTLIIMDDIADSFDYRNKYAIIEYIKDICDNEIFMPIILTHNFGFYRTVAGLIDIKNIKFCFKSSIRNYISTWTIF
jgi:wobble nucleotide-excising tRNase